MKAYYNSINNPGISVVTYSSYPVNGNFCLMKNYNKA